jgi:hypothetical protein
LAAWNECYLIGQLSVCTHGNHEVQDQWADRKHVGMKMFKADIRRRRRRRRIIRLIATI